MARKPPDHEWVGFTLEESKLLDRFDFYGNNAWTRTSQAAHIMPKLLSEAAEIGLAVSVVVEAMQSIGYRREATHQIERWESKRTTGKFGR